MKTVAVCEAKQRWFGMLCKAPVLCLSLVAVLLGCDSPASCKTPATLSMSHANAAVPGCVRLIECCEPPETCSCENTFRPNVIVGVPPEAGAVRLRMPELEREADRGMCPAEFNSKRRRCSWSFWVEAYSEVLLVAYMPNGSKISTLLQVKEDTCARNVAYIELVSSGTQWVWSTPEYINPCQEAAN